MEKLRLSVILQDYQLARLAMRVLNNELSENVSENKEDVFLRRKLSAATLALGQLLYDWWTEPTSKHNPASQVESYLCIDEVMIINLTIQTLRKKITEEIKDTDDFYLRYLIHARNTLQEVMIDLWNEPPLHENSITVIN